VASDKGAEQAELIYGICVCPNLSETGHPHNVNSEKRIITIVM